MGLIGAAGVGIVLMSVFRINTVFEFASAHLELKHLLLAAAILALTNWAPKVKKLHPIYFILLSAVVGVVFRF